MSSYLTDTQRVELALPPRFFYALALCDVFALEPQYADAPDAKEKGEAEVRELRSLLQVACVEPIMDLPEKKRVSMGRRIDRIAREVSTDLDMQDGIKVALIFYYWLEDLLSRGVLICHENTVFGKAISMLFSMFNHGFAIEKMDASAQKQARKLLERLQREGYFRQ